MFKAETIFNSITPKSIKLVKQDSIKIQLKLSEEMESVEIESLENTIIKMQNINNSHTK